MLEVRASSQHEPHFRPPPVGSDAHRRLSHYLVRLINSGDRSKQEALVRWKKVREILFVLRKVADLTGYQLSEEQKAVAREMLQDIICIPYAYSILTSNMASHYGILAAGRPIFHLEPMREQDFIPGRVLQAKMDADIDNRGAIAALYRWYFDGYAYNAGIIEVDWQTDYHNFVKVEQESVVNIKTGAVRLKPKKTTEKVIAYEGSVLRNIRPEDFFSDGAYKISDFQRGTFAAHRYIESADNLWEQRDRLYFNTEHILDDSKITAYSPSTAAGMVSEPSGMLERGIMILDEEFRERNTELFAVQARIIPKRFDLSASDSVETWRFCLAPNGTILRSEPLHRLHGKYTYSVMEPLPLTEDYVSPSYVEYLAGMQDEINFLINTHRLETRRAMQGTTLVREEAIDLHTLNPFKWPPIVPCRPSYRGGLSDAAYPLPFTPVTSTHLSSLGAFVDAMERVSGVSALMQSVPLSGARTATEVGSLQASAVSRLQVLSGLTGATAMRELGEMLAYDNQQFMSGDFVARMTGEDAEAVMAALQGIEDVHTFGDRLFSAPARILYGRYRFPSFNPMFPAHQVLQAESWIRVFEATMQVYPGLKEKGYDVEFQKIIEEYMRSLGKTSQIPQIIRKLSPEEMAQAQQQAESPLDKMRVASAQAPPLPIEAMQ